MLVVPLALSVLIGVTLGLLGGGGSILTTPLLIYAFGMEPKSAIATSLLVVCVTSVAGLVQHARAGNIHWRTGLVFGAAGMAGAYLGGLAAMVTGAAVAGSLLGSRLSAGIRPDTLRRGFGVFVLVMASFVVSQQL